MKDNYVLRSDAEAQIKVAQEERDAHKAANDILGEVLAETHDAMRRADERAIASDAAATESNARADAHAETARQAMQDLADERASRAAEVDGKLRDHLAPIHMALTKLADAKHGTDEGILAGLTAAVNALAEKMNKVEAAPMAQFELEHIRDGGDRISRTKVRQVQ